MGLGSAPDSKESPEITKFGDDGTLLIENFALIKVQMTKSSFEPSF
jgi:hypothetical protein